MNQGIISIRYAKALMMVGIENKCLDALKADMDMISATVRENPMFRQILDNPVIKPPQKRRVMAEMLEKRVNPLTINFINLIIRNRREYMLADVARIFIDLYEKSKGIMRAHVVSASGLDEPSKQQLQQQINALFEANVRITTDVNSDLIGGFIFRIGDLQYDASLSSALKRIKKAVTA